MNKIVALLGSATIAALVSSAVEAGTVNIVAVEGVWTSVDGGKNVSGLGTDSIRWGGTHSRSGYEFDGIAPTGPHAAGVAFDMGTFTHLNREIPNGTSITGATLEVMFTFNINGGANIVRKSIFDFAHLETPNSGQKINGVWTCADGGKNGVGVNRNGCADKVTATTDTDFSETFKIGKIRYVFGVAGFNIGDAFWTKEYSKNTATLRGILTEQPVSEVPLPAAGFLLLGSVAGLGAVARRRKAA